MTAQRYVADCRKHPSETNCSLLVAGTEDEVLGVLVDHVVTVHGHPRSPGLASEIRGALEKEPAEGARERNRQLALTIYDAFNKRDFDTVEHLAAPNCTMTNLSTGEVFRGPRGLRTYCENWARAFPDARVEINRIVATDDGYMAELTGTGTHRGALAGPAGTLPPTGRHATIRFVESGVARDGKIVEARGYFDTLSMLAQLGIAPGALPVTPEQPQAPAQHRH